MATTIGTTDPNTFDVPTNFVTSLTFEKTQLAAANTSVDQAKAAYHAAIKARLAAHLSCIRGIVLIANNVASNPYLSSAQLESLGLKPRSRTRTKVVPAAVPALNAEILPTNEISLSWDRGPNPQGVSFLVESLSGTGGWTFVAETTKAKLVVSDVRPGVPTSFRITASKNDLVSAASPVAVVYSTASEAPALRLAA